jgi:hypothetical protein
MIDDLPEIKQGLKDRIESLCQRLLPGGRRQGRLWVAHNPVTGDHRQSPEFKVALTRDIGAWKDWRTGDKGDVIKLVQYLTCGGDMTSRDSFKEALNWSRDFLGLRSMSAEQRRRMADRAAEARREAEQQAQADQLKRMRQAERIWNAGLQDGAGSTAEAFARRYFATRHIPLDHIPNRDLQTFRFTESQEFWARAQYAYENGRRIKVQDGPRFPAVLSAMRVATGQIAAVHMTFLDPLGPRKLPVDAGTENAKIMFGPSAGAVIRISHGPEGEPPETACRPHPLIMGEGIETTASVAIETPEARAWAAGSLANMLHAPIDLPCISSIILLRDHFKHKTTEKQFAAVCEAMDRSGKPWTAIDSLWGNDFNDMKQEV